MDMEASRDRSPLPAAALDVSLPPAPRSDPPAENATAAAVEPGVALVTGAAKRIGRSISLELARAGWTVALHYRASRMEAEDLAAEIAANEGRAVTVSGDLAAPDAPADIFRQCLATCGPPTCLVNNASMFLDDTVGTLDGAHWDAHFATNLRAPVFLAQEFARHLPEGATGNIINIIDQRVWNLRPDFFSYTLSKSALWAATRTLAQSLAPRIRVNAIGPGPVLRSIHQSDADFEAECRSVLLQRGADPAEIAQAVGFILSARAMTGQMIALDGGQHLA